MDMKLKLADFMRQALSLDESAESLADEIESFKNDVNAGISTVELDSSIGPAPFLIYHYFLAVRNADNRTGKELFDVDVRTLERSAMIDSPGPRILAHAVTDDEAFILATTPATHRALTGIESAAAPKSGEPTDRSDTASKLVGVLADANQLAGAWLAALRAESAAGGKNPDEGEFVEFNEAEAALALFVLDDRSIRDLLTTLNLMIASASELRRETN